jgi:hypothetical protein
MKHLSYLIAIFFITGCASSKKLNEAAKANIRAIEVSSAVQMPKEVTFMGPGAAFGVLGALAESASSTPDAIKAHLAKSKIDVGAITREEFIKAAQKNPFLKDRLKDKGDAKIEIEIRLYGLGQKNGLSDNYFPMMGVNVRMYDKDKKLVWEKYDYTTAFTSGITEYDFKEYFKSDKAFRAAFEQAARIISQSFVADI